MCKRSNAFSRPVLMVRGLDGYFDLPLLVGAPRACRRGPCVQFSRSERAWFRHFSVVIARGPHLFPFRTEQLSPPAPMVLGPRGPGRVGRRRSYIEGPPSRRPFVVLGAVLVVGGSAPVYEGDPCAFGHP